MMTSKMSTAQAQTVELNRPLYNLQHFDVDSVVAHQRKNINLKSFRRKGNKPHSDFVYSEEGLRDTIVLDPIWMIDALKTIITARQCVLRKPAPVKRQWKKFYESGILSKTEIGIIYLNSLLGSGSLSILNKPESLK